MKELILSLNGFIFFSISLMHFYWAFGGRYGLVAAIPERFHAEGMKFGFPMKLATLFMAFVFGFIGFTYVFPMLDFGMTWLQKYHNTFTFFIIGILMIRAIGDFNFVGFFKKDKRGVFARNDSKYYAPLCLYLALSTLCVVVF